MRPAILTRIAPIKFTKEDYKAISDEAWKQRISLSQLVRNCVFEKYNTILPQRNIKE